MNDPTPSTLGTTLEPATKTERAYILGATRAFAELIAGWPERSDGPIQGEWDYDQATVTLARSLGAVPPPPHSNIFSELLVEYATQCIAIERAYLNGYNEAWELGL